MANIPTKNPNNTQALPPKQGLEQLLQRHDIWRGPVHNTSYSEPISNRLNTGFTALDNALLHNGWPLAQLIEVCQPGFTHAEWLLLKPALKNSTTGLLILLNPPFTPFAQGLIQAGLDLERLLVVECGNKADFLASFTELTRSNTCQAVLAWQPKQPLTYTELRKCLLATHKGTGLYILFRTDKVQTQSSPAALRLNIALTKDYLQVDIFKQKGMLNAQDKPVLLPLPQHWQPLTAHNQLHITRIKNSAAKNNHHKRDTKVTSLRGRRGFS